MRVSKPLREAFQSLELEERHFESKARRTQVGNGGGAEMTGLLDVIMEFGNMGEPYRTVFLKVS